MASTRRVAQVFVRVKTKRMPWTTHLLNGRIRQKPGHSPANDSRYDDYYSDVS